MFKLMLMSAPPGVCTPGCSSGFRNYKDKVKHNEVTHNRCRHQRLDKTISVQQYMSRSIDVDARGVQLLQVASCLLGCPSWGPASDLCRSPQYSGGRPNSSN